MTAFTLRLDQPRFRCALGNNSSHAAEPLPLPNPSLPAQARRTNVPLTRAWKDYAGPRTDICRYSAPRFETHPAVK